MLPPPRLGSESFSIERRGASRRLSRPALGRIATALLGGLGLFPIALSRNFRREPPVYRETGLFSILFQIAQFGGSLFACRFFLFVELFGWGGAAVLWDVLLALESLPSRLERTVRARVTTSISCSGGFCFSGPCGSHSLSLSLSSPPPPPSVSESDSCRKRWQRLCALTEFYRVFLLAARAPLLRLPRNARKSKKKKKRTRTKLYNLNR